MDVGCTGSIDLRDIESKYKLFFECALDILFLLDIKGNILDANNAAVKEYGYTHDELLSMSVRDLRAHRERGLAEKQFREAFDKGAVYETVHMRKDRSELSVEISSRGLILNNRKVLLTIVRDITKRKESEKNLARFASILEWSDDAIVGMTLMGVITDWNRGAEKLYGYTAREMIGKSASDLMPENRKKDLPKAIEVIKNGGYIEHYETERIRKDGSKIIISLTASPIKGPHGDILGISWISRDITERMKVEMALSESEGQFRGIYEQAPIGIAMIDSITGRFLHINPKYVEIIGRTEEEMQKLTFMDISYPEDLQEDINNMAKLLSGQIKFFNMKKRLYRGDDSIIWVNLTVVPLWRDTREDYPKVHIAMIEDITKQKRAEDRLLYVASFPELNPNPIVESDNNLMITYSNPTANRLFPDLTFKGATHPIFKGITVKGGVSGLDGENKLVDEVQINAAYYLRTIVYRPDTRRIRIYAVDITKRKRAEQELRESEERFKLAQQVAHVGTFEWNIQTGVDKWTPELEAMYGLPRGGFLGTHEAWKSLVYSEDRPEAIKRIQEALDTGSFEGEWRVEWPDGSIHWLYGRGFVFRDESGKPLKLIGLNIDMTERKKNEEELEKAKALAEVYLDLMGHDINNMNQVAMGYLEIAMESLHLADKERELLQKPLDTLKNSSQLIENVHKLQKIESGTLRNRKTDLCVILNEVKMDYSHIPGRSVTIEFKPAPHCYVIANELIKDVFSNLVGNAIKHSDPHKPLTINIGLELIKEKGKDFYKVIVEDNGPGIPDDVKTRLFMRFQRGKTKASGKGLGLYLVRTLVTEYHGKIWAEDRVPGDYTKGSKFIVLLPASDL